MFQILGVSVLALRWLPQQLLGASDLADSASAALREIGRLPWNVLGLNMEKRREHAERHWRTAGWQCASPQVSRRKDAPMHPADPACFTHYKRWPERFPAAGKAVADAQISCLKLISPAFMPYCAARTAMGTSALAVFSQFCQNLKKVLNVIMYPKM